MTWSWGCLWETQPWQTPWASCASGSSRGSSSWGTAHQSRDHPPSRLLPRGCLDQPITTPPLGTQVAGLDSPAQCVMCAGRRLAPVNARASLPRSGGAGAAGQLPLAGGRLHGRLAVRVGRRGSSMAPGRGQGRLLPCPRGRQQHGVRAGRALAGPPPATVAGPDRLTVRPPALAGLAQVECPPSAPVRAAAGGSVAAPARSGAGYEHKVERGQTLSEIARGYNKSMDVIMKANKITNPSSIRVGQVLFIPD